MFLNCKAFLVMLGAVLMFSSQARAGDYADKLGHCLVMSATSQEKHMFNELFFVSIAQHPAIASYANVSVEKREEINKVVASVFESLIGDRCKIEAYEAYRKEGKKSFETAIQLLAASAIQQLFAAPEVVNGMQAYTNYVDFARLAKKIRPVKP